MTALRALEDWRERKADSRTELSDAQMDLRVMRLDFLTLANECRRMGRALGYIGIRDGSPDAHQLGVDLEAKGNRALRQVGAVR